MGATIVFISVYVIYRYYMEGRVDLIEWLGYPVIMSVAYWAGKQYDKAVFDSEKDVVTNLYNRRFVINTLNKVIALADRNNGQLFVLVIDCDNFKEINDRYNHTTGDMVLALVGRTLTESTRKSDIVARWGGDEFLVIGQYTGETGLRSFMQRLDENIKRISAETAIPLSVSIGSAVYPTDHKDIIELIKIADQNMYGSKNNKS